MKEVFQTQDGKTFTDRKEAEKHEDELFKAWLETKPTISVEKFLEVQDDESPYCDCCDATQWRNCLDLLRYYWELSRPDWLMNNPPQNEFKITGSAILLRLKELGLPVPDSAELIVRVPGGGDWSNMDLELNEEPLIVRSK